MRVRMTGGYLAAWLVREQHWPFAAGVVAALAGTAALGALLEVTVLRRLYRRSELEQVLFTIGLSFVFVAGANLLAGPEVQLIPLPAALAGQVDLGFRTLPAQRLLVVGCGLAVLAGSVWLMARTRFGVWLRATVDNTATASALAIPVQRVYVLTSPRGGAGGLGGISVPRDAPIRFTRSSISSSCLSSWRWRNGELRRLLRRSAQPRTVETASKYWASEWGSLFFFVAMALLLAWRPHGLLRSRGA